MQASAGLGSLGSGKRVSPSADLPTLLHGWASVDIPHLSRQVSGVSYVVVVYCIIFCARAVWSLLYMLNDNFMQVRPRLGLTCGWVWVGGDGRWGGILHAI